MNNWVVLRDFGNNKYYYEIGAWYTIWEGKLIILKIINGKINPIINRALFENKIKMKDLLLLQNQLRE